MSEIPTLATLVLGGAFDATELGENDIQPNMKLIEELQQRLVTGTDEVYVELIDRAELDRVTAERDGLQLSLTTADQTIDDLQAAIRRRNQRIDELERGEKAPLDPPQPITEQFIEDHLGNPANSRSKP